MCGLCGYAGLEAGEQERDMFKEHLWMMAIRGFQSTGVASVRKSGTMGVEVKIRKETKSSANFIFGALQDKNSYIHKFDNDLVIGHCRWPTKGDVTVENAHPFQHGDLIGAHNGTIFGKAKDGKTDSEILIQEMAEKGVKEALDDLYTSDAFAVTVYDKKKNHLYLARNRQRPLFVGVDQRKAVIHWGSDLDLLRCVSHRVEDKDKYWGHPCILEIIDLEPFVLYEIPLDKIRAGKHPWKKTEIKKKTWEFKRVDYSTYGLASDDGIAYPDDDLDVFAANQSTLIQPVTSNVTEFDKERALLREKREFCSCCNASISTKEKSLLVPFIVGGKWTYLCTRCDPSPIEIANVN